MAQYLSQPRIETPVWLNPVELSNIHAQISEAEAETAVLKAKRNSITVAIEVLKNKISSLRNVTAPIRRVPTEILSAIFEWYCANLRGSDGLFLGDTRRFRNILTSVCAAWRNAAYSTPSLWSELCLSSAWATPRFHDGFDRDMITSYLSRSGDLPLDVHIRLEHQRNSTEITEAILPFCHRIRSLELRASRVSVEPLLQSLSSSLPQLEHLALSVVDRVAGFDTSSGKIQTFSGSDRLQSIRLDETYWYSLADALVLPPLIRQLSVNCTELCLNPIIYTNIIAKSPSLVEIQIHFPLGHSSFDNFNAGPFDISLPALSSLRLRSSSKGAHDEDLIRRLIAPQLKELHIIRQLRDDIYRENVSSLARELVSFQQRSGGPPLQSLILHGLEWDSDIHSPSPAERITEVLDVFPTIEMLSIVNICFDVRPLLKALTFADRTDQLALLPKLRELDMDIEGCYCGDEYPSEVPDMIESRWWPLTDHDSQGEGNGVVRLERASFAFSVFGYTNLIVEERMERCRTELKGLTVNFEFEDDVA